MKRLLSCASAVLLAACTSMYVPVPPDFTGPTAQLSDTGFSESSSKAQLFIAEEIDGKRIGNSVVATRVASYGHGPILTLSLSSRAIPAVPMKLKLLGTHQTGAPIHEIASRAAGTFFSVEGSVSFVPQAGGAYVVKGALAKEGSSIWVEDQITGQPVTEKIISKP